MCDDIAQQSKLYYLLGKDFALWQCSHSDYYSFITPQIIINKIIELSIEHFQGLSDKVIWDMFAGIGCDGLRFARHSGKVICTEINPDTYADLEHNVAAHDIENIKIYNKDCCSKKLQKSLMYNIVYFDPPWGDSFQSGEPFDFTDVKLADGTPILDLALKTSQQHHLIIKSPISSDSFEQLFGDRVTEVFTFTQQKLKFMFVKAIVEIEY